MNVTEIRRPADMERITTPELAQAFIEEQVALIREQVGDKKVLLALWWSGFICCCSSFDQSNWSAVSMCPCKSWSAS